MDSELTEWDAICRICLQEGELHSIFDYMDDKSDLNIASKVMICSSIEVSDFFYMVLSKCIVQNVELSLLFFRLKKA